MWLHRVWTQQLAAGLQDTFLARHFQSYDAGGDYQKAAPHGLCMAADQSPELAKDKSRVHDIITCGIGIRTCYELEPVTWPCLSGTADLAWGLPKRLDMRHPQFLRHYDKPGLVAPHAWKASSSGACPTSSVIPAADGW